MNNLTLPKDFTDDEILSFYHLEKAIERDRLAALTKLFPSGNQNLHWKELYAFQGYRVTGTSWTHSSGASGHSLTELHAHFKGLPLRSAMNEVASLLTLSLGFEKRMTAVHTPADQQLYVFDNEPAVCELPPYPGLSLLGSPIPRFVTIYRATTGRIRCIVYTYVINGHYYPVVVSGMQMLGGNMQYVYSFPPGPCPIYRAEAFPKDSSYRVLIAPNERDLHALEKGIDFFLNKTFLTTYVGGFASKIDECDWSVFTGLRVNILPSPNPQGHRNAYRLFKALRKAGVTDIWFVSHSGVYALPETVSDEEKQHTLKKGICRALMDNAFIGIKEFVQEGEELLNVELDWHAGRGAISLREVLARPAADEKWALPGFLRVKDRVLVHAAKGIGKTWLMTIIYLCLGAGRGFPNIREETGVHNNVLVVNGEDSHQEFKARCSGLIHALNLPDYMLDNVRIKSAAIAGELIPLYRKEVRDDMKADFDWANVIVLDNLNALWASALQSDTESSSDLNEFVNALALQGKVVVIVTHSARGKKHSLGSSAKEFGAEKVIHLEPTKERNHAHAFKANITSREGIVPPIQIYLGSNEDGFTLDITDMDGVSFVRDAMKTPSLASGQGAIETSSVIAPATAAHDIELPALSDEAPKGSQLSWDEQIVLKLTLQKLSTRKIEKETERLEKEGTPGVKRIPKTRASTIQNILRNQGLLPTNDSGDSRGVQSD